MSYSYSYGAEVDLPNGYTFRDGQLYNQFGENARAAAAESYQEMIDITQEVTSAFGPEFGLRATNYAQTYAQQFESNLNNDLNQVSSRLGGIMGLLGSDIGTGDPFYVAPLLPTIIFSTDGSNVEITTVNAPPTITGTLSGGYISSEIVVNGAVATSIEYNLIEDGAFEQTLVNPNSNSLLFGFSGNSFGEPLQPFLNKPHMAPGSSRHLTTGEINAILNFYANQTSAQPGFNLTAAQLENVVINYGGEFQLAFAYGISGTPITQNVTLFDAAATTPNATTINVNPQYALTDFSLDPATMGLLIHEIEHVDQWINYPNAAATFFANEASGLVNDIYAYSPTTLETPFQNLNFETQAAIEEDLYRLTAGPTPLFTLGATGFPQGLSPAALASTLRGYING